MKLLKNTVNLWWNAPGFPSVVKCLVVAAVMERYEKETNIWGSINLTHLGYSDHNESVENEVG